MKLLVNVITPNGVCIRSEACSVVIPTESGEVEILPGHRPLVSILTPGWMVIKSDGNNDLSYIVDQGFVRISNDEVYVITDEMLNSEDVDSLAIDAAVERATQALEAARSSRSELDPMEIERLEAKVRYHMAQKLKIEK